MGAPKNFPQFLYIKLGKGVILTFSTSPAAELLRLDKSGFPNPYVPLGGLAIGSATVLSEFQGQDFEAGEHENRSDLMNRFLCWLIIRLQLCPLTKAYSPFSSTAIIQDVYSDAVKRLVS